MMRAPAFWWQRTGLPALCLAPLAALYGLFSGRRMKRGGAKATLPVVCIGNLVVGGAGKTPTAMRLAEALKERGRRPVFLSRGYGGTLVGPVRVEPAHHSSRQVGDEPLLLASVAPTVVARDRVKGAEFAAQWGDVILMDDGLQNPSLHKDFSIAVVDAGQGIGNGWCLPAGPLRAPLRAQWSRVDACLVIGEDIAPVAEFVRSVPVALFYGQLLTDALQAETYRGLKVLAFAGIGRPEKFFETLEGLGAIVAEKRWFGDHHRYQPSEIKALLSDAEAKRLVPVTTTKDAVKIRETAHDALHAIRVLEIGLQVSDFDNLINLLIKKIY